MTENSRPQDVELAETFAEVARALLDQGGVEATLDRVCELAVQTLDSCECAGISIVEGTKITSLSSTNDVPGMIDKLQAETQEGPCIDAITEREVFVTGSLSGESRWPQLAQRAREEAGVESVLALRLFARQGTMGALNLYSSQREAFSDHDVAVGSVFAAHAAVAMASTREKEQLEAKAQTRDVIGMAKGMIIAQQGVSDDEAFDILRRASQRMNIKLRDLAEKMVHRPRGTDAAEAVGVPPG
jgi:transcriptional regulator with GAF, ATPase, and Fis domain